MRVDVVLRGKPSELTITMPLSDDFADIRTRDWWRQLVQLIEQGVGSENERPSTRMSVDNLGKDYESPMELTSVGALIDALMAVADAQRDFRQGVSAFDKIMTSAINEGSDSEN